MASTGKVEFNRSKLTREKDKTVSFSSDTLSTSEKLAIAEAKLSKRAVTSTGQIRTRERLAIAERKLADARVKATSTKTREKYLAAEKELAILEEMTSTVTKEKWMEAERAVKREQQKKVEFENMIGFLERQRKLKEKFKNLLNVDVACMLDCTSSMGSYIAGAKNDIQNIVDAITLSYENKIRVAFIAYRDHCDGADRIERLDFTEDITEFERFVGSLAAKGGGDAPEDVLGGLEATLALSWSSKNRIVFHIGDSPQHGERFHNFSASRDKYYSSEPRGLAAESLLSKIKSTKIVYYFGKINDTTDKMINEFKSIGGEDIVKLADMKNPSNLVIEAIGALTGTINQTISTTLTLARNGDKFSTNLGTISEDEKSLKDYSIDEAYPDMVLLPKFKGYQLICDIPNLLDPKEFRKYISEICHKWMRIRIKRAVDPFAEGEQRISYHGIEIDSKTGEDASKVVLKEFKHFGRGRDLRQDYVEIMETQAVASYLANSFNNIAPKGTKQIEFLRVCCSTL